MRLIKLLLCFSLADYFLTCNSIALYLYPYLISSVTSVYPNKPADSISCRIQLIQLTQMGFLVFLPALCPSSNTNPRTVFSIRCVKPSMLQVVSVECGEKVMRSLDPHCLAQKTPRSRLGYFYTAGKHRCSH